MKRKSTRTKKATATKKTTRAKKPQVGKLESLQQANGKNEQIKKAKELEELVGIKEINPFGTTITAVFEEQINAMSMVELQALAVKVAIFPSGTRPALKTKLLKGFSEYNRASMVIPAPQPITIDNPDSPDAQEALRLMKEGL